jgi:SAM-dependent methyltransferase
VFIDLGSGTGRGVLAATQLFPFARLVGIEILEGLHGAALAVAAHYERSVRPTYTSPRGGGGDGEDPRASAKIELICGSFLDLDWASCADVVFANSTCFDDGLMDEIALQGQGLRDGALFITLTRGLSGPWFRQAYSEQHKMSWGSATINIAVKRTPEPQEIAKWNAEKLAAKAKQRTRFAGADLD